MSDEELLANLPYLSEPPQESEDGDMWYSTTTRLVYTRVKNKWIATDFEGDILDVIPIEVIEDPAEAYARAMGIL